MIIAPIVFLNGVSEEGKKFSGFKYKYLKNNCPNPEAIKAQQNYSFSVHE
jgi:hypothetical protein